jgi:ribosomal protein S19
MKIRLTNKEIRRYLNIETPEFPKYVTQIINLANQNAQGTRPKVVGQMSELIKEFPGKDVAEWEEWYINEHPGVIKKATEKVSKMVNNLKEAMDKIDEEMIEKWVKDLVIIKTFIGLKFQEAVLKKGAEIRGTEYRKVKPTEESKGIDGYIGNIPVSIKPDTYKVKASLQEHIKVRMIYYKKVKNGIEIDYSEIYNE